MKNPNVQIAVIPAGGKATVFACRCGIVYVWGDDRTAAACGRCHRTMVLLATIEAEKPARKLQLAAAEAAE